MSFIRPEVSGIIWKYREPIIWVPVMLSSLWMLMNARGFLMIALCAVLYAARPVPAGDCLRRRRGH